MLRDDNTVKLRSNACARVKLNGVLARIELHRKRSGSQYRCTACIRESYAGTIVAVHDQRHCTSTQVADGNCMASCGGCIDVIEDETTSGAKEANFLPSRTHSARDSCSTSEKCISAGFSLIGNSTGYRSWGWRWCHGRCGCSRCCYC